MPDTTRCQFCGALRPRDAVLHRLVPERLFEPRADDSPRPPALAYDPFGLRGAAVALCEGCRTGLVESPVLTREDVDNLRRLFEAERATNADGPDALARRIAAFHRAIHLGILEALDLSVARPPDRPLPEPSQADLFGAKSARISEVVAALEVVDVGGARAALDRVTTRFHMPEAAPFVALLRQVERLLAEGAPSGPGLLGPGGDAADPARLAGCADEVARWPAIDSAAVELRNALSRGLYRRAAQAAEARGAGALVGGRPAGYFWLKAGDARAALESLSTPIRGPTPGFALVLYANALRRTGDGDLAAAHYRLAFARDPAGAIQAAVEDPRVAELPRRAGETYALAPPATWVPLIGYAEGLWPLPDEPDEAEPCASYHRALIVTRHGGGREELRRLAPRLTEALIVAGRL